MGSYRVLFPLGFSDSKGNAMSCTTVGAVVDVDDQQAVQLVADGKLEPVAYESIDPNGGVLTESEAAAEKPADAPASRAKARKTEASE